MLVFANKQDLDLAMPPDEVIACVHEYVHVHEACSHTCMCNMPNK